MHKTIVLLALLVAFPMSLLLTGCGPKLANPETMTELEETKAAAQAAEAELQEMEAELKKCGMDQIEMEQKIKALEKEKDALKSGD
jgi:hypothetical protein